MNKRKYTIFSIVFLLFLSVLMMHRQLKTPHYFSCYITDTYAYTSWAWQFIEALKEGIIYPRWLPLNFWGYGSPTFILYSPLAFYLVAFFNVFTDSVIAAMNIAKFIALFLSAIGMFFLVKEFYSEKTALLSAFFYIFSPHNISGVYLSGAFASAISLIWFSPILFFTYRYIENRQYKYMIYAGACYGGLILTHLINAYMFTFVMVAFIIYMSIAKKRPKGLIVIPFVILTGVLISAAYLLPLIYEKQLLNTKAFITGGFHFANFFILPNLTSKFPSDHFWPASYYNNLLIILFFCIIILLVYVLQILKLNRIKTMENSNTVNKFFLLVALSSIFLLFGISAFLWETIPFFRHIQFPVRWLNITAFAIVFLSAAVFCVPEIIYKKRGYHFFIASLFLILFLICLLWDYKYISSACIFTKQELMPVKTVNWTVEHLPAGVDTGKIDKDGEFKEKVVITRGEGKAEIIKWKSAERTIGMTAHKPLTVRIRTFNFPGWKAYIDGKKTEIKTEEGVGAMLIDIPEGKHTLELMFVDTPIRYYSKLISLASLFIVVFLFLRPQRTGSKSTRDKNE